MTPQDGILILDAERAVIEEADPFITELLGYSREELLGRSFREIGLFGNRAQGAAIFEKIRRDGYVRCDMLPLRIRDDGGVFVEFVGNSYLVDDRKVIQFNLRGVSEQVEDPESRPPEGAEIAPLHVSRIGHAVRNEVDSLLDAITRQARTCFGADAAELFLYCRRRKALERAHAVGIGAPGSGADARPGEGLAGKVWETGKGLALRGGEPPYPSALGAPVRWRSELLGVLGLLSSRDRSFSESDRELLGVFAAQAAVAIVNSRLSVEIEQLAVVDELTRRCTQASRPAGTGCPRWRVELAGMRE